MFLRRKSSTYGLLQDHDFKDATPTSYVPSLPGSSVGMTGSMPLVSTRSLRMFMNREREKSTEHTEAYYSRWEGRGIEMPKEPDNIRDFLSSAELRKNEDYLMHPKVREVFLELGWDKAAMLDGSAILLDERDRVVNSVWFKKLKSSCGSVMHRGRNAKEGEIEEIILKQRIVSQFEMLSVKMVFKDQMHRLRNLCAFNVSQMDGESMVLGQLTRKGAYWNFRAVGDPTTGRTVGHFLKKRSNFGCLTRCPSYAPIFRNIVVSVVKATGLAAADGAGRFRKSTPLSDPYYEIRFKQRLFASAHIPRTLDPVWKPSAFDLGAVTEAEQKGLKISVFSYDPVFSDGFLGTVRIPARALYNAEIGERTLTFPLGQSKMKRLASTDVSGEITLKIVVSETRATLPFVS